MAAQGRMVRSESIQYSNAPQYQQAYNNALALNQRTYADVQAGYRQNRRAINQEQRGISRGYNRLSDAVQERLVGVGRAQEQEIMDRYNAERGQQSQGLTNRGLGNTTVANSVMRGLTLDEQKAGIMLEGEIAKLTAGFQTQIGMGGLESRGRGLGLQAGLAGNYLSALSQMRTPYPSLPNMGSYSATYDSGGGGYGRGGGGGGGISGGGGPVLRTGYGGGGGGGGYNFGPTQAGGGAGYNDYGYGVGGGGGYAGGYAGDQLTPGEFGGMGMGDWGNVG